MRRPFIAGNWKMNLTRTESIALAEGVLSSNSQTNVDVALCPPCVYLDAVNGVIGTSSIGLGAQNMYFEEPGAFTGEICANMLVDIGCRYVILGHSERRNVLGETSEIVNRKVDAALAAELMPIVCLGEILEQRQAGRTLEVIGEQFVGSFHDFTNDQMSRVVIAYEPVWAIGTGQVATPEQAEEVHASIRGLVANQFSNDVASDIRIQYGGSVKPDNARELLARPNIDGALVGGASLSAESFSAIVAAAEAS